MIKCFNVCTPMRSLVLACIGVLLWTTPLLGQESREVAIGELRYFTREIFDQDDIQYPRGVNRVDLDMLNTYGVTVGVRRDWTTPDGQNVNFQVSQMMQSKFSDIELVTVPADGAFQRTFRNPYPDKILNGTNWTRQFDQDDPVDPSTPSDAMVYNRIDLWPAYGMGMQVERWAYFFADDRYDDMVIMEYVFTNTSGEARNDVYIGLNGAPHSSAHYPADLWGDYYGVSYPQYVAGDALADSMRVWTAWRADQTVSTPDQDDKGDPDSQWGNFKEAQFMSNIVLHADTSPTDETDDPNQPQKAGWSQRDFVANLNEADQPTTYEYISGPWNTGDNPYDAYIDRDGDGAAKFRVLDHPEGQLPPDWIDEQGFDPELEQEKNNLMSFGPYQMGPGEDVRIVMAFAGAMIPSKLAIDAGRAYDGGQEARSVFGVNPLPCGVSYDDMHGNPIVQNGDVFDTNGNLIANCGQTLTREQKNQIINIGYQLSLTSAAVARNLWEGSDVQSGTGTFNKIYAPASPSIEGFSENDQVRLTWTDNQLDSRGGPITGYRVYREYKRPPSITSPTDTTFLLLADVPAGTSQYIDTEVIRGEDYYYYVTAVNADGIESSRFQNRTGTAQNKQDEALAPTRPPSAQWQSENGLEGVIVVPNPYHVQAAAKYPGRRLNFLNLPAFAQIHIYTMTGDRIQTITHDSSTGDKDWERQDTFSTMEIVSGVYLFVVEEFDGPPEGSGSPTGETAIGKFVVVK